MSATERNLASLPPKSRDDLTFTVRDECGRLKNWAVPRQDRHSDWHEGVELGKKFFAEVAALSDYSEREAYYAIKCSLDEWTRGPGIECGFAEAAAKAAIAGLRALRDGAPAYDPAVRSRDEMARRKRRSAQASRRRRQIIVAARRDPNFQQFMQAALEAPRRRRRKKSP